MNNLELLGSLITLPTFYGGISLDKPFLEKKNNRKMVNFLIATKKAT